MNNLIAQKNKKNYNPDVLDALANLSSDEVFTPPKVVNQILDRLPQELFQNSGTTFLDPGSKSGVFLREIAKRLIKGLEKEIPDLEERLNHIFTKQLFGIAITNLTALMSRRSLYGTKQANHPKYSFCTAFEDKNGNIRFEKMSHSWDNGKCKYCGASESEYERNDDLETHAYEFIHKTPEEIINLFKEKNMKFDVIIGNPPYQMSDGGGTGSSAMPIYQEFIEQAKKLNPRYLTMIIPSRWFTGGRGLDKFRNEMLNDERIRELHDFFDAGDVFPGVEIKGGVCYFLWDNEHPGKCKVASYENGEKISEMERKLLDSNQEVFIRYNNAIGLLKKISKNNEASFMDIVSANDPFGFDRRVKNSYKRIKPDFKLKEFKNSVKFFYNGWRKDGIGYINKDSVRKNQDWINKWKVYISKAWGVGDIKSDRLNPFLGDKNSCCTETYLLIGPFNTKGEAENVISYINTKFFHFLVGLSKITQNTMKKEYKFVPMQDFSKSWDDEKLYKKYNLTKKEIEFIEKMVRPME